MRSGLSADLAVAAPAYGKFQCLVFRGALFIMNYPIHEGLECVTAFRAQGLHRFLLGIFHPDPLGVDYIDAELILFTNIAKGLCQVKKILTHVLIQPGIWRKIFFWKTPKQSKVLTRQIFVRHSQQICLFFTNFRIQSMVSALYFSHNKKKLYFLPIYYIY